MTPEALRHRAMLFAVQVVLFCRTLPASWEARRIGGQLIDSSTSLAMNYRAAGRGRSHREFTAKLGIVVEEADETLGWLEMITHLGLATGEELERLVREAKELVAIFWSSYATARLRDRSTSPDMPATRRDRRSPDRRSPDSS